MKLTFVGLALAPAQVMASLVVQLAPSLPSPQPVGTPVRWVATASDGNPGVISYRFSVVTSAKTRIVRDFAQASSFTWGSASVEGPYTITVTARNNATQETAQASVPMTLSSRVLAGMPVVTPAANPLVALVSTPPCPDGSQYRVMFRPSSGTPVSYTDWRACNSHVGTNTYVAGMRARMTYQLTPQVGTAGVVVDGPTLPFTTGALPADMPVFTVLQPAGAQSSLNDRIVLFDLVNFGIVAKYPVATDLQGHPLWYYAAFDDPGQIAALLTRTEPGGAMLALADGPNSNSNAKTTQILREFDVAGNTVRETNASRLQEQLAAFGEPSDCRAGGTNCVFGNFHHEIIRLPNGHTLALGDVERMFPAGTQAATGTIDIVGTVIVELDENFQLVWYWNAFDHLDIERAALLHETCSPGSIGCPPLFLASSGNDWLHANSLQLTADGNLLLSLRHQDWVIKIDYRNGAGTGQVLWRLGHDGDFTLEAADPWPWFSHQHDAAFEADGNLTVFDNGNTRVAQNPGLVENSRGQAYVIDEANRTARKVLDVDLGVYSAALGSAQRLSNGNYHFLAGFNNTGQGLFSQAIEATPAGTVVYRLQTPYVSYRSFRQINLYVAPAN